MVFDFVPQTLQQVIKFDIKHHTKFNPGGIGIYSKMLPSMLFMSHANGLNNKVVNALNKYICDVQFRFFKLT